MKKQTPFRVESAGESSGFLLWQVTSLWQRDIRHALQPLGLTHSQFVLLASTLWLSMHHEELTQVMLSDHSKIDPMTTSQVLKTLQAKKYVRRVAHSQDTRAKCIVLTDAGVKLTRSAVRVVEEVDEKFFAALAKNRPAFNAQLRSLLS